MIFTPQLRCVPFIPTVVALLFHGTRILVIIIQNLRMQIQQPTTSEHEPHDSSVCESYGMRLTKAISIVIIKMFEKMNKLKNQNMR